jgi:formate/nitrite transporter FocA (FNT family)
MGARSVSDKIFATLFPITAFIACGFEHSVANMYFLPIGVLLAAGTSAPLSVTGALSNLALVTLGNVLGGTVLVALVYWTVYLRPLLARSSGSSSGAAPPRESTA